MTARPLLSPGHCSVHVEPSRQFTPHAATSHTTLHVEPSHVTVLDAPRARTAHVAPFEHSTLALAPTVKSQIDPSQSGLVLSPVTTSHVAPIVHCGSHELPHEPAHEVPVQFRSQLDPSALHPSTCVQPQEPAPPAVAQVHAVPEHAHSSAAHTFPVLPPPQPAATAPTKKNDAKQSILVMQPPSERAPARSTSTRPTALAHCASGCAAAQSSSSAEQVLRRCSRSSSSTSSSTAGARSRSTTIVPSAGRGSPASRRC